VPGSSGFVTVKAGKETGKVPVTVSDRSGSCLILNKTSVNAAAPKAGKKAKTLTLKVSKPKQMSSNVKWRVLGDPTGITVRDGKVRVSSNASPGCYIVRAESDGYTSACCEVIVK
nr:hypothetical protein [Lachnospiraceae bacterium]